MSTTVMVFGTFDIFHKGHEFYFQKAKEYGDKLIVVIARDETVAKIKGFLPQNNEQNRLKTIEKSHLIHKAILGNLGDKFKVIEEYKPDVLVFGYDQQSFNIGIEKELKKRNLEDIKIVQIKDALKPQKYKSSLFKVSK
ncbi:MAG: adenylyltransferase/cytidyltransferase family protein [Candidatus Nanoarchaeia archaeon]